MPVSPVRAFGLPRKLVATARIALPCALLCGVALAAGVGGPSAAGVVAQAGPITMNSTEVRALVAGLPAQERAAVASNLNDLEQVVHADLVRRAVLAEANASGFDRQPDVLSQLDQVRDEALVRLWVARKAAVPAGYPSDAELQAAYTANRQALAAPTQYHLEQIFISAPDGGDPVKLAAAFQKAATLSSRMGSEDFSALATRQSEDPTSAAHGGDLGYVPENRLMPEILAVVRSLKPGQVAGPIKTAQGLRFLKLVDKKPGEIPSLAEVHDTLAAALRRQRAAQLQQTYLSGYNAKLGVAVNQIELAKLQSGLPR